MNNLTQTASVSGEYKFIKKTNGVVTLETDWIPNLITNIGMDRLGAPSTGVFSYCRVGTGNSTPDFTNTQLDAQIAVSAQISSAGSNVSDGAPNYGMLKTTTFTFAQGAVVGNVTEVGVGWATTGATLFSRALILDGAGNPTTLTLTSIDQLTVFYRVRMLPTITDVNGSVTLAGTSYSFVSRVSYVNSFCQRSDMFGVGESGIFTSLTGATYYADGATQGAITSGISGTNTNQIGTVTHQPYSSGTYYRDSTVTISTTQGNFAGGIRGIQTTYAGTSVFYSYFFSTPIPKDNTKTLALTFRTSWARA